MILVCAAGLWYLVFRLGLFERPLEDRLGGPQAEAIQPTWLGLVQVLTQSWLTGVGTGSTWPSLLLAAAVLLGAVVAWRRRRLRWVVASYVLIAVLFALAAGTDDVVTKLADRPVVQGQVPAELRAPDPRHPARRHSASSRRPSGRARVLASVSVACSPFLRRGWSSRSRRRRSSLSGMSGAVASVFRMPDTAAEGEVVSLSQIDLLREARRYRPGRSARPR